MQGLEKQLRELEERYVRMVICGVNKTDIMLYLDTMHHWNFWEKGLSK